MKQLILIRHAKSSWNDFGASDFDRELNKRGLQDAPEMGRRLAAKGILPDVLLASSAKRARATAELIATELGISAAEIQFKDELYLASPATMLQVIRQASDDVQTLALVTHNPGITELTNRLARTNIYNMPTCGIAVLQIPAEQWKTVGNRAELLDFDYPKRVL